MPVLKSMPTPFSWGSVLDFVKVGIETNWWGLSCPHHCGPPSLISLLFSFLSGLSLGLLLGFIACFTLAIRFGFVPVPSLFQGFQVRSRPVPTGFHPGVERLSGYLYE